MASYGDGLCEVHQPSLIRLSEALGQKAGDFVSELAKHGVRSVSMNWLKDGEPTDGELIPVVTFTLVEQL
jgi:hypothetical protein